MLRVKLKHSLPKEFVTKVFPFRHILYDGTGIVEVLCWQKGGSVWKDGAKYGLVTCLFEENKGLVMPF